MLLFFFKQDLCHATMSETVPLNLVLSGTSHKRHNWSISNPLLSSPPPSCALSLEVHDVHCNEVTLDFDHMTWKRRRKLQYTLEFWAAQDARAEPAGRERQGVSGLCWLFFLWGAHLRLVWEGPDGTLHV